MKLCTLHRLCPEGHYVWKELDSVTISLAELIHKPNYLQLANATLKS